MKKVASAMYLTKLEKQAKDRNESAPTVNPDEMKLNVDTLMKSKAFQMMFDGANAARETVSMVANGRMSSAFEILDNNKAILKEQREREREQQAQNQREIQQELNAQQRNRANSMHQRQNPQNQEAQEIRNEQQRQRRNSLQGNQEPRQLGGLQP